jgi:hypothetical protein
MGSDATTETGSEIVRDGRTFAARRFGYGPCVREQSAPEMIRPHGPKVRAGETFRDSKEARQR